MKRKTRMIIVAATAGVAASVIGGGVALGGPAGDDETPITGPARARAEAAALAYTGGGRVTGTETGDEESYYEVEVTMPDGGQVDVQLDENFVVVGSETDDRDDESGHDGDN
jgi:hypothetical protein